MNRTEPLFTLTPTESDAQNGCLLSMEARVVLNLVERWGMVASEYASRDDAGRAYYALLSPTEVVERAINTTRLMFDALDDVDWIRDLLWKDEAEFEAAREAAIQQRWNAAHDDVAKKQAERDAP